MAAAIDRVKKLCTRLAGAIQQPTEAGQLWRRVLFFLPTPLPVFGLVALIVGGSWAAPGVMILLSGSVAVASLLLALVVQPTPLPEGLSAEASVRRSLHRFRQITALRIALALTPVGVGAGASIVGGGLFPLLAALALAWPQLVLASPIFFTITRARRAMEAWGTKAYLWAALAQPAPVEWPIATTLAARYRDWRSTRAGRTENTAEQPATGSGNGVGEDRGTPAEEMGLPERLAVTSAEPKAEPGQLIPGFPMSAMPTQARRILRSGIRGRPKGRSGRANARPKAKN
ncbi:MAG: hypothetical protein M0026_06055 [Nocardiopsaceae bacterium]|nr:hypothetical protein [Nocardiopsaceae bacterium]